MKDRITVIGITGRVASGKSTVAKMLGSLGAQVIDADKICHELLEKEEIRRSITKRWGNSVQNNDGKIDRRLLGTIVFNDKTELSALNSIIHPRVIIIIQKKIHEMTMKSNMNPVVIDAALLIETDLVKLCDKILFINTDPHLCEERAQKNRNWPSGEIVKRERFQSSLREKMEKADCVIDNGSTKADTFKQLKDFWKQITTQQ